MWFFSCLILTFCVLICSRTEASGGNSEWYWEGKQKLTTNNTQYINYPNSQLHKVSMHNVYITLMKGTSFTLNVGVHFFVICFVFDHLFQLNLQIRCCQMGILNQLRLQLHQVIPVWLKDIIETLAENSHIKSMPLFLAPCKCNRNLQTQWIC